MSFTDGRKYFWAVRREMVHMAIDGMWQVFDLQSSTSKNDFCRIFAKSGVLVRLVNTLHNLNEVIRAGLQTGASSTTTTTAENHVYNPTGIVYLVGFEVCYLQWYHFLNIREFIY